MSPPAALPPITIDLNVVCAHQWHPTRFETYGPYTSAFNEVDWLRGHEGGIGGPIQMPGGSVAVEASCLVCGATKRLPRTGRHTGSGFPDAKSREEFQRRVREGEWPAHWPDPDPAAFEADFGVPWHGRKKGGQ